MSSITKKAITLAFIRLAAKMPIEKISVAKITDECGISRNTFYYHYRDVYALVEDIVYTKSAKLFDLDRYDGSMEDALRFAAGYVKKNRRFIRNIYDSVGRSTLEAYLSDISKDALLRFVTNACDGRQLSDEAISAVCELCRSFLCAMALDWIGGDQAVDPLETVEKRLTMLRGCLGLILDNSVGL